MSQQTDGQALRGRRTSLTRQDWIAAALEVMAGAGIAAVKVEALATALGATRGSFYWHFADHADLQDALIQKWTERNVTPFRAIPQQEEGGPRAQLARYAMVWLTERFDPGLDAAVREWGRSSDAVGQMVAAVDDERIAILNDLFTRIGYEAEEALVRARIWYYHQVGYYSLRIAQPRAERLALFPVYFRVLAGFPMAPDIDLEAAQGG